MNDEHEPEQIRVPPLVTMEEVALHLKLSLPAVRSWIRRGAIPRSTYVRVGQTYRFDMAKVMEALHNNTPVAPPVENNPAPIQLELDLDPNDDY